MAIVLIATPLRESLCDELVKDQGHPWRILFYDINWQRKKILEPNLIYYVFLSSLTLDRPNIIFLHFLCIPSMSLILLRPFSLLPAFFLLDCCLFLVVCWPANPTTNFFHQFSVTFFDTPKLRENSHPTQSAMDLSHLLHSPLQIHYLLFIVAFFNWLEAA